MRPRPDQPPAEPHWLGSDDDRPLLTPRTVTAAVACALTFVLALVMLFVTPPYAVQSPGPTVDTIGEVEEDTPLITVEGAETYPTEGELRLTTVSTRGGPGYPATAAQVIGGWLSETTTVLPRETAFDPAQTPEEVEEESTLQMSSSQTNATVAALTQLGYDVPMELRVAGTAPHGAAHGRLETADLLGWISTDAGGRTELTSFAVLTEVLAATDPGSTVTLGVVRGGEEVEVEVVTDDDGDGGSLLGVMISPDVDMPLDVEFAIENIGGPSGGLMLTLGIIDILTPGSLTGGEVVAGTGTVDLAGDVGPIGGIQQKMAGAVRDGAAWFLAPVENCDEVTGAVPDGLEVVAVDTVEDATAALEALTGGRTADLPRCPAP
ncbi:PDZ domain-containing protein [Georgenia sp. H159]|uniref:YlbL family protein n=1 Tax=Georgenia sp. H159 TaxID=3076115 RepID=UPI002D79A9C8|nr:S16 family serine protease [Georgenia sp. H159]